MKLNLFLSIVHMLKNWLNRRFEILSTAQLKRDDKTKTQELFCHSTIQFELEFEQHEA